MKNRCCEGACLPVGEAALEGLGLMLRSSRRTILSKPYCFIRLGKSAEAQLRTFAQRKVLTANKNTEN